MGTIPSASPESPIRRTSFHRICSLTRMLFLSIFHLRGKLRISCLDCAARCREKTFDLHGAGVPPVPESHGHGAGGHLLLSDHEHTGDLLDLRLTNARAELLALLVRLDAQPPGGQPLFDLAGLFAEPVGYGQDDGLQRREPEREIARRVLDQDAEETLDGPQDRAVKDDGTMGFSVLADVGQVEALGMLEIALDRAELPRPTERVLHAKIDLGAVEGAVSRRHHVWPLRSLERARQCGLPAVPELVGPDALFRAKSERDLDVGETEGAVDRVHEIQEPEDLVFDLVERREDVRVVLRKSANARQTGGHAGTLVTMEASEI